MDPHVCVRSYFDVPHWVCERKHWFLQQVGLVREINQETSWSIYMPQGRAVAADSRSFFFGVSFCLPVGSFGCQSNIASGLRAKTHRVEMGGAAGRQDNNSIACLLSKIVVMFTGTVTQFEKRLRNQSCLKQVSLVNCLLFKLDVSDNCGPVPHLPQVFCK